MAIEIVPKPKKEIQTQLSSLNFFYYLVIGSLMLSFLSYFVLNILTNRAEKKLSELETAIFEKETREIKNLEQEVILTKEKIDSFADLLKVHKKSSNFFEFFKQNCHQQVVFSKLDIDTLTNEVVLAGIANNFRVLGEQILIFQVQDLITKVDLVSSTLGKEGKIEFNLEIELDSKIFNY